MELCSRDQEEDWLIESGNMGKNIPEQAAATGTES